MFVLLKNSWATLNHQANGIKIIYKNKGNLKPEQSKKLFDLGAKLLSLNTNKIIRGNYY